MGILRSVFLAGSQSRWLRERATRYPFVRRSVSRFMPGERLDDALVAATDLQSQGAGTILTHLGENLTDAAEADVVARHLEVLDKVTASGLGAQISVKLTQLGLDLNPAHRPFSRRSVRPRPGGVDGTPRITGKDDHFPTGGTAELLEAALEVGPVMDCEDRKGSVKGLIAEGQVGRGRPHGGGRAWATLTNHDHRRFHRHELAITRLVRACASADIDDARGASKRSEDLSGDSRVLAPEPSIPAA